jgi:uncharacterized protein
MIETKTLRDDNAKIRRLAELDKSSLPSDGGENFNRLIFARSPYLLQHAENPVDWHQWGDAAFAKAKSEDKPVFLSIGYATCHWCHVMEHESFESIEVAALLNQHFVSIKVDREERPDIDDQYMTVAQMALEGGAGWPLTILLDHDRKPFYVATYIPRESRPGMPGIIEILQKIIEVWQQKRDVVETTCASIIKSLAAKAEPTPAALPEKGVFGDAYRHLEMLYDQEWGGFGTSPKFPRPLIISFLQRTWKREGKSHALDIAQHSLKMMRKGGIYDQIGYGFHRYSVDRKWLVPHFEKMLYDQGLLAIAYIEAFQISGDVFFREVVEEIFAFVLREMTSPEGGFYSAIDADSEGSEGRYYLWSPSEIQSLLGKEAAETLCNLYDITEEGNFEGENIPHRLLFLDEFAAQSGIPEETIHADLEKWRNQLLVAREKRVKPLRDEKVLTSWNGLMIAALAKGFAVTGNRSYLEAAERALNFVRSRLTSGDGRLLRSFYAGESGPPAFLEDYTFLVWGIIELYGATLNGEYLRDATALSKETLRLFADESSYGLYDTGSDTENVLIRKKSAADGIIPSGNSVAAMNFLRLGKITSKQTYIKEGEGILRSLMGDLLAQPSGYLHAIAALDYLRGPDLDITLVGNRNDPETEEMLRSIAGSFIPGLVLRFRDAEKDATDYKALNGRTTAYVCSQGTCRPPVNGREALEKILGEVAS